MTSLKALIIDDEPLAHKIVERFASDIPFVDIVGNCHLATEAYTLIEELEIDLIFLDIQMPKLTGLEFLRTIEKKPQIIITSAYEEYALEGFELQVTDYLLKPFSFDRFLKAVNNARKQIASKNTKVVISKPQKAQHKKIFVKVDKKQIQIESSEIHCIESYGNYVKIWRGKEMLLTPRTLSSFEHELNSNEFQRVHKSYIIQKPFIDYVEGNMIFMKNGLQIPIGKSHRKNVKEWF